MNGNISVLEQYLHTYRSVLAQEEDPKTIISDLLVILRNYSLWEQELRTMAETHAPLSAILAKSAEIVHNPILIFDLDGNLLGQSNLEKAIQHPTFAHVWTYGKMSASALTVRYVNRRGQYRPDLTDSPQLTRPENSSEEACLSMYFSIDGERVGYCLLVLLDLQELELDQQFLTYLKPYFLQAEEFVDVASPARSNQSIVTDLLSGAGGSPEAIQKFLKSTGLGSPFQLLEIHSNGIVNYTQRSMLVRDLKELDIPLFAMEYDKRVLILTEAAHIRQLAQRISETINTGTGHLSIGISMPFSSLEKLCAAHLQSVFAIEETGYQDGFFYCRDFAFNYLLRILQREELTKNLLHPAVEILSRYDQKNGSDLLSTLRVYMEQGMNQIHTANALFIHRNTLKYRLAKISELTDIDLSDPDEKLYLSLSLRLS
jgi:hypothetical protein